MNVGTKEKKVELINNFILLLISIICLLITLYCGYKIINTPYLVSDLFYKIIFFSSLILSLFFLIIIKKFNTDLKIIVSIFSISIIISLYILNYTYNFCIKTTKQFISKKIIFNLMIDQI